MLRLRKYSIDLRRDVSLAYYFLKGIESSIVPPWKNMFGFFHATAHGRPGLLFIMLLMLPSTFCQTVTTVAGSGAATFADGVGSAASFYTPVGVVVDTLGNIYVGDHNNLRIRKISYTGAVTTLAGSGGYPYGVALDTLGNIYVATVTDSRIRKISPAGAVTTLAGSGTFTFADGVGTAASFNYPYGVAVDTLGTIYVADQYSNRIRVVSSTGAVTTLAGSGVGSADGVGTTALFNNPLGVAVDTLGNVYVADTANNRIRVVSATGAVTKLAGSGAAAFADGLGTAASFNSPCGVALDTLGNVYVVESANNRIRVINSAGVVITLAGSGSAGYVDGVGTAASFNRPSGVALDSLGNVYVGDSDNNRIRKVSVRSCAAGYHASGGVCTICPVGFCCLGNLTAATACLGSTAQGAAVSAGE